MKGFLATLIGLGFAVSVVAQAVVWKQEPTGFRGLAWGASMAEAKKEFPEGHQPLPTANTLWINGFQVGTVSVNLNFMFKSDLSALNMVTMEFPLRDLKTMKTIFVAKYGQPTGSRMEYQDKLSVWKGKQVEIEIGADSDSKKGSASFTVLAVDRQISKEAFAKQAADKKQAAEINRKAKGFVLTQLSK